MRIVYNIGLYALAAAALTVLMPAVLLSAKRRKTLRHRLWVRDPKRLPPFSGRPGKRPCWVHALSVGEVQAALPLIRELKRRRPDRPVVLSASTLTGYDLARRRAPGLADRLCYFPYDLPFCVRRAATAISPELVILVETDLWPNFLWQMAKRQVPVALVNARLSERSLRGYRRIRPLVLPMLRSLCRICVQSDQEAERFAALGVNRRRLAVTGNLKFDQEKPRLSGPDPAAQARETAGIAGAGPVIVAGSTHPGEEKVLAGVCAGLKSEFPGLHLVVAPRDPDRAASVRDLLNEAGLRARCLTTECRQQDKSPDATVVDRIGLLGALYAAADAAFVGGSLAPFGGHNPLEAAAWARPIVFGPDMSDFRTIASDLIAARAAVRVENGRELASVLRKFFRRPEEARTTGDRALAVFAAHRGAVARTLDAVEAVEATPAAR